MNPRPDPTYSVYDVFTPTTQATLNFVPRAKVNDRLVDALRTPGKQLIVYGETGSGKSTLLLHKLKELYPQHITTRCSSTSTFTSILLDAFDQLSPYYRSSTSTSRMSDQRIGIEFARVRAAIDRSNEVVETHERVLPPQLSPQRLGEFLGHQELCWVLEDFHKTPAAERTPLSQTFKIFSDLAADYPAVRIIAIGATETARQVVEYDREMSNRVAEILVPLMDESELQKIIHNGQKLMNIDLSSLEDIFVQYAMGVASVCHQLSLNACLQEGIEVPQLQEVRLSSDHLEEVVKSYVADSSDTLKYAFDRALHRDRVRQFDNCRLILKALSRGPLDGLLVGEILADIRLEVKDYPQGNLTTYLRQLTVSKRASVLRCGIDGRYRFIDPLHHAFAQITLSGSPQPLVSKGNEIYELSTLMIQQYVASSGDVFNFRMPKYSTVNPPISTTPETTPVKDRDERN